MILCSLRILLHKSFTSEASGEGQSPNSNYINLEKSHILVQKVVRDSLDKLSKEDIPDRSIRWELGSCWVQHLQKQETPAENSSKMSGGDKKSEPVVKGLGKKFKMLKNRERKPNSSSCVDDNVENNSKVSSTNDESTAAELHNAESESETELRKIIPKEAYLRLRETGTGLHTKVSYVIFSRQKLHFCLNKETTNWRLERPLTNLPYLSTNLPYLSTYIL